MRDLSGILAALSLAGRAADERDARLRAGFRERTGHPRGPAAIGPDAVVWRELEAAHPRDDAAADALVAEAVEAWLAADPSGRSALLGAFEGAYLRWRAGWVAGASRRELERAGPEAGRGSRAGDVCRRALAACTLASGRDERDTIVALDALYLAALRAGLDPAPLFAEAAEAARSAGGGPAGRLLDRYAAPERAAALRRAAESGGTGRGARGS